MRKQEEPYLTGNLTAMIDVVFQLIIFFVCAISMQNNTNDESITLVLAPNGMPAEKITREVKVDIHKDGSLSIAHTPMSPALLGSILTKTVQDYGGNPDMVPVILRGDASVLHEKIQGALDACSEAGIVKIRFAALKEKGR